MDRELNDDEVGVACGAGQMLALRPFKANGQKPSVQVEQIRAGVFVLENDNLRVVVERGCITSLYGQDCDLSNIALFSLSLFYL